MKIGYFEHVMLVSHLSAHHAQCLKPLNCRCKQNKTFFPKRYFTFLCNETTSKFILKQLGPVQTSNFSCAEPNSFRCIVAHLTGQKGEFGGLKCIFARWNKPIKSENQIIVSHFKVCWRFLAALVKKIFFRLFCCHFFSVYFLNVLQSDNNNNSVYA